MSLPHIVDRIGFVVAFGLPAFIVFRFRKWKINIVAGALVFWLTLYVTGRILARIDDLRGANMLDQTWFIAGWLAALVYASLLYAIRCAVAGIWLRYVKHDQPIESAA